MAALLAITRRALVRDLIKQHPPDEELQRLRRIEEEERERMEEFLSAPENRS